MTVPGDVQSFDCHRGIVPSLGFFVVLAVAELLVVHLVLSLTWPRAAWIVSGITLAGVIWLIAWVRSFRRCPHVLTDDSLVLRMGSLVSITVRRADIEHIEPVTSLAAVKAPGVRNLVPVAMPNRLVVLRRPIADRRGTRAVAIRLDDPAAFDRALT